MLTVLAYIFLGVIYIRISYLPNSPFLKQLLQVKLMIYVLLFLTAFLQSLMSLWTKQKWTVRYYRNI